MILCIYATYSSPVYYAVSLLVQFLEERFNACSSILKTGSRTFHQSLDTRNICEEPGRHILMCSLLFRTLTLYPRSYHCLELPWMTRDTSFLFTDFLQFMYCCDLKLGKNPLEKIKAQNHSITLFK